MESKAQEATGTIASLKADFAWTFAGNAVYYASQWLSIVIIAKLATPDVVGEYVLGVAVCAPVILLMNLQLRALFASDLHGDYPFAQYLRFRIWSLAVALALVAVVCAISHLSFKTSVTTLVIAAGLALEVLAELYYGVMQKNDCMKRIAMSLMMKGPAAAVALGVTMHLTHSVASAAAALAAARGLVWFFYDRRVDPRWLQARAHPNSERANPRTKPLTTLVRTSITLGLILMAGSLNSNMPRYFIQGMLDNHELGIFSALASLLGVGNMLMAAIGQSSFLRIARAHVNRDGAGLALLVLQMVGVAVLAGCCAILVAVVGGPVVLSMLFRPEYGKYSSLFIWLMTAGCVGYVTTALGSALTAIRCFGAQLPLLVIAAAATALSCQALIPAHGLIGAAQACLIGNCVHMAGAGALLMLSRTRSRQLSDAPDLAVAAPLISD